MNADKIVIKPPVPEQIEIILTMNKVEANLLRSITGKIGSENGSFTKEIDGVNIREFSDKVFKTLDNILGEDEYKKYLKVYSGILKVV
jgi:hypothetical protein